MTHFKKTKSMKPLFFVMAMLLLLSVKTSYSQQNCWSMENYPSIDPVALQDSTQVYKVLVEWEQKYKLFYDKMLDCPMPTINEITLKGDSITNKNLKGKVVMITFWSTESPSYNVEIRRLDSIRQYFQDKNVVFIGIAKESKENVVTYLKDKNFKFNLISDGDKLSTKFANNNWPHTYIFDKQSKFKAIYDNIYSELEQQIIEKKIAKLLE
jgi:peroxiredoxin